MVTKNYSDIEDSYYYVSTHPVGANEAYVSIETGHIYWISDFGDSDELPDDFEESDRYLRLPNRDDLDLGTRLVREFARKQSAFLQEEIASAFSRRGAYQRYKSLLARHDLLDSWYRFEAERTREELQRWCNENGVSLVFNNTNR